jgi:formylglycine-generating enzyme required for sulfatase activity
MKSRPIETVSRALLALLLAGLTSEVEGAESRRVVIRLEAMGRPVIGASARGCTVSRETATGASSSFWISFGRVHSGADRTWKASDSEIRCGEGASPGTEPRPAGSAALPYFKVATSVTPLKASGVAVDVSASLTSRKLSEFSPTGEPIYGDALQRRMFTLEQGEDAAVPLLVSSPREETEFGIHEIMLHLSVQPVVLGSTDYGAVSIRSDTAGVEVFLDGGRVGRTSKGRELLLRNVIVGDREVRIRDASGRVARRKIQVRKDRTVLIALGVASKELPPPPNGLVPTSKNYQGFDEYRRRRDGAVMVKIPEGEFHMGNLDTEGRPLPHTVYVSTFLFDKMPVTWGQYEKFLEATGWPLPPHEPYWGIHHDQPAVFVTWEESRAYCEWVGGRLPTEAEREKAARGTDERKYPWGDEEPNPTLATFRRNWGSEASTPVGSHPAGASPYGLLDTGGNVWEWCEDWWDADYFKVSPKKDPRGPATGRAHVVKGGSWDSRPSVLSASARNFGYIGYREGDFGFRCAADAP